MRKYKGKASTPEEPVAPKRKRAPARSLEARENQLINLTYDQAEAQLLAGTASSQTMHHFLVQGSTKWKLEKEELERKIELLTAKTRALEQAESQEELVANAIEAMQRYTGGGQKDYED